MLLYMADSRDNLIAALLFNIIRLTLKIFSIFLNALEIYNFKLMNYLLLFEETMFNCACKPV